MNYTYTINGARVYPRGDWTIVPERNEGQIFFRKKLRGELTFMGDDYATIMGMSDCDELEFKIYCGADLLWTGQFHFPTSFTIDADSCEMTGEPEVVDEYTCIMNNYDTEYVMTSPAVGGIAPILTDCAGGVTYTMVSSPCHLFVASTASGSSNWFGQLLNGVNFMNCGYTIVSSFMFRDNFPDGTNYAGVYGTNNYITGATNRLEYIYLVLNSLVRQEFGGTGCDGDNFVSIKEFEEVLRNRFNAYWYIDQNGSLRIEHIHFFDPDFPYSDFGIDTNLKEIISNNGRSYAHRRNKYSYEDGRMYDQETFSWQHYQGSEGGVAHGLDFEGVPIYYGAGANFKNGCVPGAFRELEIPTSKYWSDITWAYGLRPAGTNSADTIACPGYLMLDIDPATQYIQCEASILAAGNIRNMHLSTAGLQNHYFQYDRMFLTGNMNSGGVVAFQTAKKFKLQEKIEYPYCCIDTFDPMKQIRTEMGDGTVKSASIKKRSIEVELLY